MKLRAPEDRLFGRTDRTATGCWEFTGYRSDKGYGEIKFEGRMEKTHRLAWILTQGPIPPGLHVLHRCDNPPCVNPEHLFLGTNSDNVADRVAKGRSGRTPRDRIWSTKLTPALVRRIRELHAAGWSNVQIAPLVGVNDRSISNVVLGKTWRDVE